METVEIKQTTSVPDKDAQPKRRHPGQWPPGVTGNPTGIRVSKRLTALYAAMIAEHGGGSPIGHGSNASPASVSFARESRTGEGRERCCEMFECSATVVGWVEDGRGEVTTPTRTPNFFVAPFSSVPLRRPMPLSAHEEDARPCARSLFYGVR
jgi:hypothetical protein